MLYTSPALRHAEEAVIDSINAMCARLERADGGIGNWSGLLSRQVFERTPGSAFALVAHLDSAKAMLADTGPQVWRTLQQYRNALRHAAQPALGWTAESILALHSMMTEHDSHALPGKWRTRQVKVLDVYGKVVYEAPDADRVPLLMAELVDWLNVPDGAPPIIRAAMVHLNILRIHPFQDGNGRMARCLQAAILLRLGVLAAETANLEEYVGQQIRAYNDALEACGTSWDPNRDTRSFIRFCLTAHYRQAIGLVRKLTRLEHLCDALNAQASARLSDKTAFALGEIFGARPDVIQRWWRMRPDRVIERLMSERDGYKLRDCWGAAHAPESHSRATAALLIPASMDPTAPLPDPFKLLDDSGLT